MVKKKMKKKKKVIILGFGLVGKALYLYLKKNSCLDIKVIAEEVRDFTQEQSWYFLAEKKYVVKQNLPFEVSSFIREENLSNVYCSYIGQHSSIHKYEQIYSDKARCSPAIGTRSSASFRKYFMDEAGFAGELANFSPVSIYRFGDEFKNIEIPEAELVNKSIDFIDIRNKIVSAGGEKYQADFILSTIPIDILDSLIVSKGEDCSLTNYDIDCKVGQKIQNYPVFCIKTSFSLDEFKRGRRRRLYDFIKSDNFTESDYIRLYDFDQDSSFYQHIILPGNGQINVYSLTVDPNLDILSFRVYNPGRISRIDSSMIREYIYMLERDDIYMFGRYGLWEGGWTVLNDLVKISGLLKYWNDRPYNKI